MSSSCTKFDSCEALLEKITVSKACISARRHIMNHCFGGGTAATLAAAATGWPCSRAAGAA
ncbi:MAG: hypothetical protein EOO62_28755 [Hymenobacter sp.]|nr:MAG: hypothetical protein EOO62_28755 [Hymenobacter sp.]